MATSENILEFIGNTPLLKLRRISQRIDANIYVKCEWMNPSGSTKDRIALKMIEGAELEGKLKTGSTIIDMSSGNTGPALSFVGNIKGYKVRLYIPSEWSSNYNPENRIKIMKIFGADTQPILVKQYDYYLNGLSEQEYAAAIFGLGMKACYDSQRKNNSFWWANQMANPNNTRAHKEGTGYELVQQLEGKVDAFITSIGTGGTLLGVYQALTANSIDAKIVGLEPEKQKVIEEWVETGFLNDFLDQLGMPKQKLIIEKMLEKGIPDDIWHISDDKARNMANRLCYEEGIFCGMSSGANVYGSLKLAKELGPGANIVTLCVDRRDRYLVEHPFESYII